MIGTMDFGAALDRLPTAYAAAVDLWSRGATETEIAEALHVAPVAVPAMVELGVAKLTAVLQSSGGGRDGGAPFAREVADG